MTSAARACHLSGRKVLTGLGFFSLTWIVEPVGFGRPMTALKEGFTGSRAHKCSVRLRCLTPSHRV